MDVLSKALESVGILLTYTFFDYLREEIIELYKKCYIRTFNKSEKINEKLKILERELIKIEQVRLEQYQDISRLSLK